MASWYLMRMILICVSALVALASGCGSESDDGRPSGRHERRSRPTSRGTSPGPTRTWTPSSPSPRAHTTTRPARRTARGSRRPTSSSSWGRWTRAGPAARRARQGAARARRRSGQPAHLDGPEARRAQPGRSSPPLSPRPIRSTRTPTGAAPPRTWTSSRASTARSAALLRAIPPERRKLVSSHDSLGHFVDRYDFEFVGAPFGLAPESRGERGDRRRPDRPRRARGRAGGIRRGHRRPGADAARSRARRASRWWTTS